MSSDPKITLNRKYIVRNINSAGDIGTLTAKYLKSKNYKKIGVILADNTYVQGVYEGIKNFFKDADNVELIERFDLQTQDFRSTITKLKSKSYDVIGVFLISGQISSFYKQMAEQNFVIPTFGTDFFESRSEIKMAEGGMDGAVYSSIDVSKDFSDLYLSKYGNDTQISFACNGYNTAMLIGNLFNNLNSKISSDEIIEKLHAAKEIDGLGGKYTFTNNTIEGPHFRFPYIMKKIYSGDIIRIE